MKHYPVFAFGYTGRRLDDVVRAVEESNAVLFDIRYSPRSRAPMWNRTNLEVRLGHRYRWMGDLLGNLRYRTGGIEIAGLAAGLDAIELVIRDGPVALMCVCKEPGDCHRQVVTAELAKRGHQVFEGLPDADVEM